MKHRFLSGRCAWVFAQILMSCCVAQPACSQSIPGSLEATLVQAQKSLGDRFRSGDTNVPLLRLDSFQGPIRSCSIERSGKIISSSSNGISNSTDWNRPALTTTNLQRLVEVMNGLSSAPKGSIPLRRQIHLSGMRSNEWFYFVYDADNLPNAMHGILEIIGPPYAMKTTQIEGSQSASPARARRFETNAP